MKISSNNLQNISSQNLSDAPFDEKLAQPNNAVSSKIEYSSANGLHVLDGQMRKLQLLQKFAEKLRDMPIQSILLNQKFKPQF